MWCKINSLKKSENKSMGKGELYMLPKSKNKYSKILAKVEFKAKW